MSNFNQWNKLKKKIHYTTDSKAGVYFNVREFRFVHRGTNIKCETDGKWSDFKRPALILKRVGNMYLVLPMTSRETIKEQNKRFYYTLANTYFDKPSHIMLSQIRTIDRSRFIEKIGMIQESDFKLLNKKLKALVSL